MLQLQQRVDLDDRAVVLVALHKAPRPVSHHKAVAGVAYFPVHLEGDIPAVGILPVADILEA